MSAAQPAPDRRAILGGSLALASAVAASAAPAVAAIAEAAPHPDAVLLQLVADYFAAQERQHQHDQDYDRAFERYEAPAIPCALFFRPEDHGTVLSLARLPSDLAQYEIDGVLVPVYDGGVGDLGQWVERYLSDGTLPRNTFPRADDLARVREIADAHRAWQAAIRQAEDAAGLTAATEAGERENDLMDSLLRRLATTPATTPDGLRAKACAAADGMADTGATWLTDKHIPDLLTEKAQSMDIHPSRNLAVVFSLVVDATRLGTPIAIVEAAA